jgi:GntR family transcriptional regulator
MEIVIDIDSTTPVFTQLMEQIKQAVSGDGLAEGAALPSIRQLANELDVNSKTVAKAYKLLERDNIIQSRGYRGSFVHPEAKRYCDVNVNEWAHDELKATITKLKAKGVTDSELRIAFSNILSNKD